MSDSATSVLAARLQELKERSGRSYTALASRTAISRSTLHRYCQGDAVPDSFGVVERLGKACGASRKELAELYWCWVKADGERAEAAQAAAAPTSPPAAGPAAAPGPDQAAGPAPAAGSVQAPVPQRAAGPRNPPPVGTAPRPAAASVSAASVPTFSVPAAGTATAAGPAPAGPAAGRRAGWLRGLPGPSSRAFQLVLTGLLIAATTTGSLAVPTGGAVASREQWIPGPSWTQAPAAVPDTLFGVTMNSSSGTMPGFHVGAVRLWDSETRWSNLQPRKGPPTWDVLDRMVGGAEQARLPVLFTFGATPEWAAPPGSPRAPYPDGARAAPPQDLRDWDAIVRAVVTRYRGRIDAYELWVLAPSKQFFTGDPATLVEMTKRANRIIKQVDPRATVACPGMGELWKPESRQYLTAFAAAGGYQHCDVAAVKLHQRDSRDRPETIIELTQLIEKTFHAAGVHLPLWSTGSFYRIALSEPLGQDDANNYAVRFYLVGLYARYSRMYFYNWGGTKIPIVLQADGGPPTRAGLAVERLQRWVAGTKIQSCGHGQPVSVPANVWQCRFVVPPEAGGGYTVIRWTDSGEATMSAEPGAREVAHLDGRVTPVVAGGELRITESPVLVRYAPA